jgi:cation diffusion facilitator CzcD-associated flavoprotein CzcO
MDQAIPHPPAAIRAMPRLREALRIAIIGAGFAGIGLAILLKKAGFTAITIFERAGAVGGTWRENTYPGAACDVQSHLYSFSFAPRSAWSQRYSGQAEILEYLQGVARDHGILPYIRLNTAVAGADYDETAGVWRVHTQDGAVHEADIFIPAVGQLSRPAIPAFAGLADFEGAQFHSAAWDHTVELRGKRVALVGCAASGVQILPELTKVAAHVDVFQRTPNWLVPRGNGFYPAWRKALFKHVPAYRRALRLYIYLYGEFLFDAFRTGSWRNKLLKSVALKHLATQVADPDLRARLTPAYELGCKRVLFSDDFYPCFAQPHVTLVTSAIAGFTRNGIRTADGTEHAADVAIFATGFNVTNCLSPVAINGGDGVSLQALWQDGPFAYRGVAVPGFPNMLIMYGPNTNLGHNSIIVMLEAQARYIVQCLERVVAGNLATIEVSQPACRAWNEKVQRELGSMVWSTGCGSWYESSGGRITANWSGSTLEYRRVMKSPVFADFVETVSG